MIEPRDLPETRSDVVLGYSRFGPRIINHVRHVLEDQACWLLKPQDQLDLEVIALKKASLFYASQDTSRLAGCAAKSLPATDISLDIIPSSSGFIYFAEPQVEVGRTDKRQEPNAVAVLWIALERGIIFCPFTEREDYLSELATDTSREGRRIYKEEWSMYAPLIPPLGTDLMWLPYGLYEADPERLTWESKFSSEQIALLVIASWLLMNQKELAEDEQVHASRSAQKRIRRAGHSLDPVRVVRIGQKHKQPHSANGHSDREFSHRWIVQGHWRNQAYGEGRALRRPKWIAPYVKGPEDKPLVVRETVNLWK